MDGENSTRVFGITGGIGSGKTTVCQIFASMGVPVYNADDAARTLMHSDPKLVAAIKATFGDKSYLENDSLDKVYLAREVFSNPDKLATLNGLVHPEVQIDFDRWVQRNSNHALLLKEAALIFETGSYRSLHGTILVTATLDMRIERLLLRDKHRTKADIEAIMAKQMPEADKLKLANFVIYNDEQHSLIKQCISFLQSIVSDLLTCPPKNGRNGHKS